MALGITATLNNDANSPGVQLVVSGIGAFSRLLVERVDESATYPVARVRGLDNLPISTTLLVSDDYEAPIGLPVTYKASVSGKEPGIALAAKGAFTEAATEVMPDFASGSVAGDYHLMYVNVKPYTATVATPSGWTLLEELTSGTNASGADSGSIRMYCFSIEGAQSGTVTVTATGSNVIMANIMTFRKYDAEEAWVVETTAGADSTVGTNFSVTAVDNLNPVVSDLIVAMTGHENSGTVPPNLTTMTMPNTSLSSLSYIGGDDTQVGDNLAIFAQSAKVLYSTGAGAPTIGRTSGANIEGVVIFVRLSTPGAASESATSSTVTIPYDNFGDAWLKSVFVPEKSRAIEVESWPDTTYETRVLGEYNVLGRTFPVILTDGAWGHRTGSITITTYGRAAYEELKDLIRTGGTLLFQTTGEEADQRDMYLEVRSYSVQRRGGMISGALVHTHQIDFTEIDQPNTSDAALGLHSYQDVLDDNVTYSAVLSNYATLGDNYFAVLVHDL